MLDRAKLITQLQANANKIIKQQDDELGLALKTWQIITTDSDFKNKLTNLSLPWSIPSWDGDLGMALHVRHEKINYTVVASDGSQIYPDRHMGSNYYLINTGVVILNYDQSSSANFYSEPYFFTEINDGNIADYVDSKRHELEIADGFKIIRTNLNKNKPVVYLADGSLLAWHLSGKGDNLCDQFLPTYFRQLQEFYLNKVPFIGYISLPNSKELVNLLRANLCDFGALGYESNQLEKLVDADLMTIFLQPLHFTNWFKSNVTIAKDYPAHLRPYFAYCNTGNEIARIELPAWILSDNTLLKVCMQIVVDQVQKGYGYPVALSEAHQQAVIKSADRDFFYQIINQVTKKGLGNASLSRKLRQKRVMGI